MKRGLFWLPLLALFIGLAWAGWAEYKKIEVYQAWAADFEQAKYDVYSVIGYRDGSITWGKATRKGIVALQTIVINDLQQVYLCVDDQIISDLENLPNRGEPSLVLSPQDGEVVNIPFTDVELTAKWVKYLHKQMA